MIPPSWYIGGALALALSGALYALKTVYTEVGTLQAQIAQQGATEAALRRAAEVYAAEVVRQQVVAVKHRRESEARVAQLQQRVKELSHVPVQECFDDPVPDTAAGLLRQLTHPTGVGVPGAGAPTPTVPAPHPGAGTP